MPVDKVTLKYSKTILEQQLKAWLIHFTEQLIPRL